MPVTASTSVPTTNPACANLLQRTLSALTAQPDKFASVHPLAMAAGLLWEGGRIDIAFEQKALEYGCSVDAVTYDPTGNSGGSLPTTKRILHEDIRMKWKTITCMGIWAVLSATVLPAAPPGPEKNTVCPPRPKL